MTDLVQGDGAVTIGVSSRSRLTTSATSRESKRKPKLIVKAGPDVTAPTAPTSLSASPAETSIALTWAPSSDDVGVAGYRIYVDGVPVATTTAAAYEVTGLACDTSYEFGVEAYDAAANTSQRTTTSARTSFCSAAFTALADARVEEGNPSTNFGSSTALGADLSPKTESFLRFEATGIGGTVVEAKIRVYVFNGSADGAKVYRAANEWSEGSVSWNSRPERTSGTLSDAGSVSANAWFEHDVTAAVTGNGTYSFNVAPTSTDGQGFYSRETTDTQPALIVRWRRAGDATAPTAPPGLAVSAATADSLTLTWSPSTDDVGVAGYRVIVAGVPSGSTPELTYTVAGLTCGTVYSLGVEAYDAAGNVSPRSSTAGTTSACVDGQRYYVDGATGSDANAGTAPDAAWRTLARASAAVLAPNDQLLLKRGVTWSEPLEIAESGTLASPIVVGAYGVGSDPVVTGASSCIILSGSFLRVQNIHADACSWAGFDISGRNNRVESSRATRNAAGVHVRPAATGAVISRNELRDNNVMSVLTPSPTNDDSGAFAVLLQGAATEVAHNAISGSSAFSYDYGRDGSAIEIYGATFSNVHHNLAVDNETFAELGKSTSADNTFAYNVARSSLTASKFVVTRGAASPFGPVLRTTLYNNTAALTGGQSEGFICHAGCDPTILRMRNNIVQAVAKAGYADGDFDEGYNLYWGGATQFNKAATSTTADPRFVDLAGGDVHLRATSPAIDRGTDVALARDFDGRAVPVDGDGDGAAIVDIGGFEYDRGDTPSPADTTAPTAAVTSPADGSTVSRDVSLAATASDDIGVTQVKWYVDGAEAASDGDGAPWSASWNSTTVADGTHELIAKAADAAGNWGTSAPVTVTVANASSAGDVVIAAAGDIACAPPGTRSSTTCHQADTASLITAMNPDKVLMIGDAQYEYGTLANFDAVYEKSWGAFKAKTLATAGTSHDFYGGGDFFTYFGYTSFPRGAYKPYSVDVGAWHIISMNSGCSDSNVGGCGTSSSQYAWLKADLEANTKKCVLAMWHRPYWTSGYRHDNYVTTRPFVELLYQHGAELLLTAHEHAYERLFPMRPDGTRDDANGIASFVVGTGGKSLESGWGTIEPNSAARQLDTFGVLRLALHASSYDWQFTPEAGKTYTDTGSASCH